MQDVLYTIGHEGAQIEPFIATLREAGVKLLIDVREAPISRKRDFAKTRLAHHLESAGIAYRHLKALGTPKPGREAAKAGDRKSFARIFAKHIESEAAQDAVQEAADLASAEPACLLCLERDSAVCHRSVVAERIAQRTGLSVAHLLVPDVPAQGALF